MASTKTLSPFLPSRPLTPEQRALFDQYQSLAYSRAGWALRKYDLANRTMVRNAALIGLMFAASRYVPESEASFLTFATRTIDWTIRNLTLRDLGIKQVRDKRPKNPRPRFEPSAYRAAGELPDAFFDSESETQVLVDQRTPEEALDSVDREVTARRILHALSKKVGNRNVQILKRHLQGEKLAQIALDYGITRERARQIVEKTIAYAKVQALKIAA